MMSGKNAVTGVAQYREVKRKANVGERIKVVAVHPESSKNGNVRIGEEFTVKVADGKGEVWEVSERAFCGIISPDWHGLREYVVLEPVEVASATEPDALYAAFRQFVVDNADAIRAILPELEALAAKAPAQIAPTKPDVPGKLTRAAIIAKATTDVAELTANGQRYSEVLPPGSRCYGLLYNVKFRINRDKRVVVCEIVSRRSGRKFAKGFAKAAPDDVFHAEIGKAIALRRALGLPVPDEYVNAPQPEKAEVGAKVYTASSYGTLTVAQTTSIKAGTVSESCFRSLRRDTKLGSPRILDDTDVDYTEVAA